MVDDMRAAKRELKDMLMLMSSHRNDLAAYLNRGDAFGVERCERVLKIDHTRIREYCAKHDLELPRDVPPAGAE